MASVHDKSDDETSENCFDFLLQFFKGQENIYEQLDQHQTRVEARQDKSVQKYVHLWSVWPSKACPKTLPMQEVGDRLEKGSEYSWSLHGVFRSS